MSRDNVLGIFDLQTENLSYFDTETIDLLTLFSTQASMALQNARLYSLERRRAQQLEAINAIAKQTTAVLDLKELLDKVCSLIQSAFPVSHVSVLLKEEEDLVLRAHYGSLTLRVSEGGRMPANRGLWGKALSAGRTIVENDVTSAPDYVGFFLETASRTCIPLVSFGQTLGVLVLDSEKVGHLRSQRCPVPRIGGGYLFQCHPERPLRRSR